MRTFVCEAIYCIVTSKYNKSVVSSASAIIKSVKIFFYGSILFPFEGVLLSFEVMSLSSILTFFTMVIFMNVIFFFDRVNAGIIFP